LQENNDEEYRRLIEQSKNTRLKMILEQTDEFFLKLGAIVQQQKVCLNDTQAFGK